MSDVQTLKLSYLGDLLKEFQIPAGKTVEFVAMMKKASIAPQKELRIDVTLVTGQRFYVDVPAEELATFNKKKQAQYQQGFKQYIIVRNAAFEQFITKTLPILNKDTQAVTLSIEALESGIYSVEDLYKAIEKTRTMHYSQAKTEKTEEEHVVITKI